MEHRLLPYDISKGWWIEFCSIRAFVLWYGLQEETEPLSLKVHPPPSGRHAMRCLYVIGRDGWVWDMSNTQWLDIDSSHRVGECSVSVVCPLAGVYSRRRLCEIIVVVVDAVIALGSCSCCCSRS